MSLSFWRSICSLRMAPLVGSVCGTLVILLLSQGHPAGPGLVAFILFVALTILGAYDLVQSEHSVLRNYPILGHLRFLLEDIRPEIRQYFLRRGMPELIPFRNLIHFD